MLDFATLVPQETPNTFLVCTEEICQAAPADMASPVFEQDAETVRDAWLAVVAGEPRVTQTESDDAALQYDFVQRSALFRFPDTITVRFISLESGGSTVAIYSRSKYGRSDLGVNKKRVTNWLNALETELGGGQ